MSSIDDPLFYSSYEAKPGGVRPFDEGEDAAIRFICESNAIEGINREPKHEEIEEFKRFMALEIITVEDMVKFVSVYQPDAELRIKRGLNVRVWNYYPPPGGEGIKKQLKEILDIANSKKVAEVSAYFVHQKYEKIHPFTDCNGRSGRMLWIWMRRTAPLGFLHTWYYQSLSEG